MTPKFTTPAFIRRNTPELRKKLEDLGYNLLFSARNGLGRWLVTTKCGFVHTMHTDIDRFIDCGTNEQLFLALAALREDSDYMQWFYYRNCPTSWYQSEDDICKYYIVSDGGWLKATPEELIKHFKEK